MGIHDSILVRHPLVPKGLYQTKDLQKWMETYLITPDGRLFLKEVNRAWVDDPNSILGGYLHARSHLWVHQSHISSTIKISNGSENSALFLKIKEGVLERLGTPEEWSRNLNRDS